MLADICIYGKLVFGHDNSIADVHSELYFCRNLGVAHVSVMRLMIVYSLFPESQEL